MKNTQLVQRKSETKRRKGEQKEKKKPMEEIVSK